MYQKAKTAPQSGLHCAKTRSADGGNNQAEISACTHCSRESLTEVPARKAKPQVCYMRVVARESSHWTKTRLKENRYRKRVVCPDPKGGMALDAAEKLYQDKEGRTGGSELLPGIDVRDVYGARCAVDAAP